MKKHDWIPVAESLPPKHATVIAFCGGRIFAGWLAGAETSAPLWWSFCPTGGLTRMGDMRATDFWLALPEYPADFGAVRTISYPA